jgi:calpain family cysteine protease
VNAGAGSDVVWVDANAGSKDTVAGYQSVDTLQEVSSFANGADTSLGGDKIADPLLTAGRAYRAFHANPLFAAAGPTMDDVEQGILGDCYLLAGLSAIAKDDPAALRENVVDFDDGTYGVRLSANFYRVDDELAVMSRTSTQLAYAELGAEKSMWVAVVEKAFAHYRRSANSYAALESGWAVEAYTAFRASAIGDRAINSYRTAAEMADHIASLVASGQAVTIGFTGSVAALAAPLVMNHMYAVASVARGASGSISTITLRNPWGIDGANNKDDNARDRLVTVTPAQIFAQLGRINWGRV